MKSADELDARRAKRRSAAAERRSMKSADELDARLANRRSAAAERRSMKSADELDAQRKRRSAAAKRRSMKSADELDARKVSSHLRDRLAFQKAIGEYPTNVCMSRKKLCYCSGQN